MHRPDKLENLIGNEELKKKLRLNIDYAIKNDVAMQHCLVYSNQGGLGKTSFGLVVANELNRPYKIVNTATITKLADLIKLFSKIEGKSIIILDEVHNLNAKMQENLYTILEDFQIDVKGDGSSIRINIPEFTMFCATTKIGKLQDPFVSRFGIVHFIENYSTDDLAKIGQQYCKNNQIQINQESLKKIAQFSRGIPRNTIHFIKQSLVHSKGEQIDIKHVKDAAKLENVQDNGVNKNDLLYLQSLYTKYGGGPAGIRAMSVSCNIDKKTLEESIEPFLIRQNLICVTDKGRVITPYGVDFINGIKF